MEDDWRYDETLSAAGSTSTLVEMTGPVPGLTILAHADPSRVGERVTLPVLAMGHEARLSRLEPSFKAPRRPGSRPLEERSVSRRPICLVPGKPAGTVVLDPRDCSTPIAADGVAVTEPWPFSAADLKRGVVLLLGRRVALLLHLVQIRPPEEKADLGLVGDSVPIVGVKREILRLAPLDVSVLLRGETGTGKELVARALHEAGPRRSAPFVAVNMASISPALAASELFGARKGAYTGADRKKVGFFQHAEGGTLFLDEIGETPSDVQPMLLRALESHEILPVGSVDPVKVNVRVVAATDARLESAIATGDFRAPLLHRLAGYTVRLPALAERRDDVGRLFFFFLKEELAKLGRPDALAEGWPSAEIVARLARHDWPGNVRELRNLARWTAIAGPGLSSRDVAAQLEKLLDETAGRLPPEVPAPPPATTTERPVAQTRRQLRKPEEISEQELLRALRESRFKLNAAAAVLGISRTSLYRLIEGCPSVRKAADLGREEIEEAMARNGGDPETAAEELEVSSRGLKRRMTSLGMARG